MLKLSGLDRYDDEFARSGNGLAFVSHASEIAPIIMRVGNHEWYFTEDDYKQFENEHTVVLDDYRY